MASSAGHNVVKAGYWFFGSDKRRVADIPSELFTHLYAGFAKVDSNGKPHIPSGDLKLFTDFNKTVRARNPSVKTLLSIGGTDAGDDLSSVVANKDTRKNFIEDSIQLATKCGFDGLDLCWLYPSDAGQEIGLRDLLIDWRLALDKYRNKKLLLTAAVFHHSTVTDQNNTFNYPIQAVNEKLDWINVLAIDFFNPTNSPQQTGPVHAWLPPSDPHENRCGESGIENWKSRGLDAKKLVVGLPFHGYVWNTVETDEFGFFAPARGESRVPIAYKDIQEELRRGVYETVYDRKYDAVYSHKIKEGNKWIGYDDACSISGKVSKAIEAELGGYFAWHVGADDSNWTLSRSAFESSVPPAEANDS